VQLIKPYPVSHWYFYLEFVLLASCGIFWLYKMNESLGLYEPLFIIPLLQSFYILFGVISGGIYFEEFASLTAVDWPLFILGMVGILSGLYLIAPTKNDLPPPALPPPSQAPSGKPSDAINGSANGSANGSTNGLGRTYSEFDRTFSSLPECGRTLSTLTAAAAGSGYRPTAGNLALSSISSVQAAQSRRGSVPYPSVLRETVHVEHIEALAEDPTSPGRVVLEDESATARLSPGLKSDAPRRGSTAAPPPQPAASISVDIHKNTNAHVSGKL